MNYDCTLPCVPLLNYFWNNSFSRAKQSFVDSSKSYMKLGPVLKIGTPDPSTCIGGFSVDIATTMTTLNTNAEEPVELQDVSDHIGHQRDQSDAIRSDHASDAPPHAVDALQKWNQSRSNIVKTLSTFFSFVILGANDAAYG